MPGAVRPPGHRRRRAHHHLRGTRRPGREDRPGIWKTIGARPGDIVGVALGDDADHIVALLAIAWLGAVILPMDVRWTGEEKRRIAGHFGARFVLVPEGEEPLSDVETIPRRGMARGRRGA